MRNSCMILIREDNSLKRRASENSEYTHIFRILVRRRRREREEKI